MKLLITGSSGMIGSALLRSLPKAENEVVRLVRSTPKECEARWNPTQNLIEEDRLKGIDAAVHLAGESIAAGRWSSARKARILDSRTQGTRLLATTLARLDPKPKVLVSASAVGFYGHRGDKHLSENDSGGEGFLAGVCRQWEAATAPAADAGIRVVHLRIGVVLSPQGGVLKRVLLPFRMGVGGIIGDGSQYISWITLDDVIGAIHHVLADASIQGAVNVAAPNPVTNAEFTKSLGQVLRRPAILPIPAFALRLLLGEMAAELLLVSTRVQPTVLERSRYVFRHPHLRAALTQMLS